jgi:WD40 repeat protein
MASAGSSASSDDYEIVDQEASLGPEALAQAQAWLQPTDYTAESSEFRRHLFSQAPGTGLWICHTPRFRQWHDLEEHGSLWIKGVPGAGKSVIAASIVEHLKTIDNAPVLFFFFRYIMAANRRPRALVRDWLAKLLPHSIRLQASLQPLLSGELDDVSDDQLWEHLLTGLSSVEKAYCVVDALDEMELVAGDSFLRHLNRLGTFRPAAIRLLITSRPKQYIQSSLRDASIVHISLEHDLVGKDIAIFVLHRLRAVLTDDDQVELLESLASTICEKSRGLFLYARLLLDQIIPTIQSAQTLDVEKLTNSLPIGLEEMSGKIQPQHIAFPAHPRHVITCLQFDEDKILTGSDDTYIHVYDTKTGKLRKRLEGHEGGLWALQYEGNVLVSGSTDSSVRVWDIEKGLCTQVFHGHTSTVRCLQILLPVDTGRSFNGKPIMTPAFPLIITGSRDSQLRVWRLPEQGAKRYIQTGPPANDADCPYFIRVLGGHTHPVRAIAAYQDTLVSGSYDCSVRVWKISTGETLHQLRGHGQKVYSVVLDHMRRRCISGSMDNTVKIWSLDTGANLYTLEGHSSLVGLLDLRDGRLVSASADSTLRIWDPENGQCMNTLTAHTGAISCFQHDGTKVISGSDRTLKMWNVQTGECLKDLLTDLSGVWQVKFDERRCVAAVQRGSLTYIEASTFSSLVTFIPLMLSRYLTSVHFEMAFHPKTVAGAFFCSLLM